jgi:hypothetical protein
MGLLFDFDLQKRVGRPTSKINLKRRVVCLTFASRGPLLTVWSPKAIALRCDCCPTVCRDFIIRWDLLHAEWIGNLEFRWLRLAEQAHERGGALGHESGLMATLFPLRDKPELLAALGGAAVA